MSDHADDDAAVAAYEAGMRDNRPDLRLVSINGSELNDDAPDFVARVADDFAMDATSVTDDEIVKLVALYAVEAVDEA